jgi:hypothetical protein
VNAFLEVFVIPSCINSWLCDAYCVKNYTYYLYILQPLHHEFCTIKSSFFSGHDLSKRCSGDTGEGFRGMIMQLARGVCMLLMIFFLEYTSELRIFVLRWKKV